MKVSKLYPELQLDDVYIIGAGPSLSYFSIDWLAKRTCIVLNDVSHVHKSLGPIGFMNNSAMWKPGRKTAIRYPVVNARGSTKVGFDDPRFYVFSYTKEHDSESVFWKDPNRYWCQPGSTVAVFAIQFAVYCGAKTIFLVGCDCNDLYGRRYFSKKIEDSGFRKSKRGGKEKENYPRYLEGLLRVKREVKEKFGAEVMTLSPFIGIGMEGAQE